MSEDKIIELSVDETNQLRVKLGLAPLRTAHPAQAASSTEKVLELSVDESNQLRERLGLKTLNDRSSGTSSEANNAVIHAPARNEKEQRNAIDRIERARLQRQVQEGTQKFSKSSLSLQESQSAKDWVKQMRAVHGKNPGCDDEGNSNNQGVSKASQTAQNYSDKDLEGITVAHTMNEFEHGSEMVLTLQDTSILKGHDLNDEDAQLENVTLVDHRKQQDGLKAKRKMEMGMGRAGGYAGFDDDEFEELGGVMGPSLAARGSTWKADDQNVTSRPRGFQIGAMLEDQGQQEEMDAFRPKHGRVVSLQANTADVVASDFMTAEEDRALRNRTKEAKFKKKKKKDKNHRKTLVREKTQEDDSDEEHTIVKKTAPSSKNLLEELNETAIKEEGSVLKKRRRGNSDGDAMKVDDDSDHLKTVRSRAKYDQIMNKGNQRTKMAFQVRPKVSQIEDEEPDDAFLNAALAKARRLNRLKEMAGNTSKGADAVVEAIRSSQSLQPDAPKSSNTISFSINETQEFTRALSARAQQVSRQEEKKKATTSSDNRKIIATTKKLIEQEKDRPILSNNGVPVEDVDMNGVGEDSMDDLAKEVEKEEEDQLQRQSTALRRGVGGILGLLRDSGGLSREKATREELRGRAKDERNYEDYEPINLTEVVKIDKRRATDKDREFASREVKLEYRDEHGRLLTRKEAFRDLSYQFHGYGSGKRKEEKKKKQIQREQVEARVAARQANESETLNALRKTQEATGKAYVVHKT